MISADVLARIVELKDTVMADFEAKNAEHAKAMSAEQLQVIVGAQAPAKRS